LKENPVSATNPEKLIVSRMMISDCIGAFIKAKKAGTMTLADAIADSNCGKTLGTA